MAGDMGELGAGDGGIGAGGKAEEQQQPAQ